MSIEWYHTMAYWDVTDKSSSDILFLFKEKQNITLMGNETTFLENQQPLENINAFLLKLS